MSRKPSVESHYVKVLRSELKRYKREVKRLEFRIDRKDIVDILLDINQPCVGCCRAFRVIDSIPFTSPCCGRVFFEVDT